MGRSRWPRPSRGLLTRALRDGATAVTRLGDADVVAPAADGAGLWLITWDRPHDPEAQAAPPQHVPKVDLAGRARTPRYQVPSGYVAVQGLGGDLLPLAKDTQVPGDQNLYEVWNPRTGQALRLFDRVLASSATTVAWVPSTCGLERCPVHLTRLAGGGDTIIPSPRGAWATFGLFSPDGLDLALSFSAHADTSGGARSHWQLAAWRPGEARLRLPPARAPPAIRRC